LSDPQSEPAAADGVPKEDFEDLYLNAPCGYLSMHADGRIFSANTTLADWTGIAASKLTSKRFSDLLTVGTRIFYETHGAPMLRLQGHVEELALELRTATGGRMPVFVNGLDCGDRKGQRNIRMIVVKAIERRRWEREIVEAREASEQRLRAELDTAGLREQFIAVLGHDLRNPLASIGAGMSLLKRKEELSSEGLRIVEMVLGSVGRMSALIEDVLDFARARLGGRSSLNIQSRIDLAPILRHLAAELQVASPGRIIEAKIDIPTGVDCDPSRLGQLVSNLLGNALTHGASDAPVRLEAVIEDMQLVIAVSNQGMPIPPAAMERLFQPFVRGDVRANQEGLGLGLYIANEIAKAHQGVLGVASSLLETRFTLRMPLAQPKT
jgi:sigma-B regulation protein RsbU (phosphoserine phosphatase)